MKTLKQIAENVITAVSNPSGNMVDLLWQLICYSPKWPLRLQQEQLLAQSTRFTLEARDEHFTKKGLQYNGFIWGKGRYKVLLTHGWGSKAADFIDIITPLTAIKDLQLIAFDAPGNGSSAGELSNLNLFVESVKGIIQTYGVPDIMVGHSLGTMANIIALQEFDVSPRLLISITPLVKLKENFEATMTGFGVSQTDQEDFLADFEKVVHIPAGHFNLNQLYHLSSQLNHHILYDENDHRAPYGHLKEFLDNHPQISRKNYPGVGHERVIKSPDVVADIVELVKEAVK